MLAGIGQTKTPRSTAVTNESPVLIADWKIPHPFLSARHAEIDTMHKIILRQEIEIYEQSGVFMKNFIENSPD